MRCPVCGLVVDDSETPTAQEAAKGLTSCDGCAAEVAALLELRNPPGHPKAGEATYTQAQAEAIAQGNRQARGMAAYRALKRVWLTRVASGKSARDGSTAIVDFIDAKGNTISVAKTKADARARLDAMDAEDATRAAAASEGGA